jgi:SSS family solute:Na+ symporter
MSSADTTLLSASTIVLVNIVGKLKPDLSEKEVMRLTRLAIVLIGLCSLALALVLKGVISALLFAYTIYTCGVILPVIAGFYRDRLKVTANAATAAICGGGIAAIISKILQVPHLDTGALGISALLLFLVSYIEHLKGRTA